MKLVKINIIYWGIPVTFSLAMIGLYFSGDEQLVDWVAPRINTLPWAWYGDRELGLLENAQHLLLLACVWVLIRFSLNAAFFLQRLGAFLGAFICLFMFLEEIDYGTHYWDWWTYAYRFEGDVNFHNVTGSTSAMKVIADVIMVIWFVVLPLLSGHTRSIWIRYLAAPKMIILTLISGMLISNLAHLLDDQGLAIREAFSHNISEFRETFTYYIWFLYCNIMVRRPWPSSDVKNARAEAQISYAKNQPNLPY